MPKILCPFNANVPPNPTNPNGWSIASSGVDVHPEFQPSDGVTNVGIDHQFPNNQPVTKNAIPSVFAKWSLLDTAFKKVAKDGKGVDIESQKLVSYALDIAEIFFNFDLYVSSLVGSSIALRIEECDIQNELQTLKQQNNLKLRNAIITSWDGDKKITSFGNNCVTNKIYLLIATKTTKRDGDGALIQTEVVLGGTCPNTIFFASDFARLEGLGTAINAITAGYQLLPCTTQNNGQGPVLLQGRDQAFQDYMVAMGVALKGINPNSNFVKYIIGLQKNNQNKLWNDAIFISATDNKGADIDLFVDNRNGQLFKLKKRQNIINNLQKNVASESDFRMEINNAYNNTTMPPLVLLPGLATQGNGRNNWSYTSSKDPIGNKVDVPNGLLDDINSRVLPCRQMKYPWITTSDIFEDKLIKLPYPINNNMVRVNNQFDGGNNFYLMPIKKEIFDYLSPDYVVNNLTYIPIPSFKQVKFSLKIQVGNNQDGNQRYITLEKTYTEYTDIVEPIAKDLQFSFFPAIPGEENYYAAIAIAIENISGINTQQEMPEFSLCKKGSLNSLKLQLVNDSSLKNNNSLGIGNHFIIGKFQTNNINTNHCYFQISIDTKNINIATNKIHKQTKACFVPICFLPSNNNALNLNTYRFAIDLGTTNTHIAYQKFQAGAPSAPTDPKPFSLGKLFEKTVFSLIKDDSAHTLNQKTNNITPPTTPRMINLLLSYYFFPIVPKYYNRLNNLSYPLKTALKYQNVDKNSLNCFITINNDIFATKDYGFQNNQKNKECRAWDLFFIKEYLSDKNDDYIYKEHEESIKWESKDDPRFAICKPIEYYIEYILQLIRVFLKKEEVQNTNKTTIIYLYPSFSFNNQDFFYTTWKKIENIPDNDFTFKGINEAYAPYHAITKLQSNLGNQYLLTIDIGGGTTDVCFADNTSVLFTSSFRLAGDVFWSNYANIRNNNQMINKLKKDFIENYKKGGTTVYIKDTISNMLSSQNKNVSELLFLDLDSNRNAFNIINLQPDKFNFLVLYFLGSIFYTTAKIIKDVKPELDKNLTYCFTGNGSKIIDFIKNDKDANIKKIFEVIFKGLFSNENASFTISKIDNSVFDKKTITANGALQLMNEDDGNAKTNINIQEYKGWNGEEKKNLLWDEIISQNDNSLTKEFKNCLIEQLKDLNTLVLMSIDKIIPNNNKTSFNSFKEAIEKVADNIDDTLLIPFEKNVFNFFYKDQKIAFLKDRDAKRDTSNFLIQDSILPMLIATIINSHLDEFLK